MPRKAVFDVDALLRQGIVWGKSPKQMKNIFPGRVSPELNTRTPSPPPWPRLLRCGGAGAAAEMARGRLGGGALLPRTGPPPPRRGPPRPSVRHAVARVCQIVHCAGGPAPRPPALKLSEAEHRGHFRLRPNQPTGLWHGAVTEALQGGGYLYLQAMEPAG